MDAEDVPVYDGGQGHAVEHRVARLPHVFPEGIPEPVLNPDII